MTVVQDKESNREKVNTSTGKEPVVVVVPVFKKNLSSSEAFSLNTLLKTLAKHPICFVHPKTLDVDEYQNISEFHGVEFKGKTFEDHFFNGIASYNKLLLSETFYKTFIEYEFMLLYQLDALVFRDDLLYWCKQGFDYIGAPWFWGFADSTPKSKMLPWSGNGGFCLRNVSACLSYVKSLDKRIGVVEFVKAFWFAEKRNKLKTILKSILFLLGSRRNCYQELEIFEDQVFAIMGARAIKVAPPKVGLRFSFETQPARLFEANGENLPFGCHAWERYGAGFWDEFI